MLSTIRTAILLAGLANVEVLLRKDAEGLETIEPIRNFGHAINRVKGLNIAAGVAAGMVKEEVESYTRGDMRIPDAVALRDPNGSPTQDNLLGVIEVKFPPDDWGPDQKQAYERIAGSPTGLMLLTPEHCGCDGPRQTHYETETQPAVDIYKDRLEEKGISWGTVAAGAGLVAAGAAATYYTAGLGGTAGGQAIRQGAGMVMGGLGFGATTAW